MMTRILVDQSQGLPLEAQSLEIVERKGLGHPDTMCDAIAEAISMELSPGLSPDVWPYSAS
ncbi:MAG: methionine adenosyltransferase [Nitrospirales bacterium]|nr:hypothetical protein [Nitrospirales bacterium]